MIRTPARPVRVGFALVGVASALSLAGCAGTTATADEDTTQSSDTATSTATESATSAATESATATATSEYADGTYTAEGSYTTPESVETIVVTLTIEDDIVTDVEVTGDPQASESEEYQELFIGGISDAVVGQSVDEVSVTRVAGSSLTSTGFMEALELIKAEAAA